METNLNLLQCAHYDDVAQSIHSLPRRSAGILCKQICVVSTFCLCTKNPCVMELHPGGSLQIWARPTEEVAWKMSANKDHGRYCWYFFPSWLLNCKAQTQLPLPWSGFIYNAKVWANELWIDFDFWKFLPFLKSAKNGFEWQLWKYAWI